MTSPEDTGHEGIVDHMSPGLRRLRVPNRTPSRLLMRSLLLSALLALSAPLAAQPCAPTAFFCFTFDADVDGWASPDLSYRATGGVPGGYIEADRGQTAQYTFQRDFGPLDLSAAYGQTLQFDAFATQTNQEVLYPWVLLGTPGGFLLGAPKMDPDPILYPSLRSSWGQYQLVLSNLVDQSVAWYASSGELATEEEIRAVLDGFSTGPSAIQILFAYDPAAATTRRVRTAGLDNVILDRKAGGTEIVLATDRPQVVTGERFAVSITAGSDLQPVNGLFGTSLDVAFDGLQMFYSDFVPNPAFVDCDGDPDTEDAVVLVSTGGDRVSLAVSRRADRCADGASGEVPIGEVVFEVPLAVPGGLTPIMPADLVLITRDGEPIPALPVGTEVEIFDGVLVWPGDTDQSGGVDGADLLPIAALFGETGPARDEQGYAASAVPAPRWTESGGDPHADANGDGEIDEADALAVGLNYGVATSPLRPAAAAPLATLTLSPQQAGSTFEVRVRLVATADALGASALLTLPDGVAVDEVRPSTWLDDGDLLAFDTVRDGRLDVAASRKRGAAPLAGEGEAFVITLRALEDLPQTTIALDRLVVGSANGQTALATAGAASMESSVAVGTGTEPGLAFGLGSVVPNPAHARARIVYTLEEAGAARVALLDALGREVAVLVEGEQTAGPHTAPLDAGALAPGVYVLRLSAGDRTATQRLTVVR